ncbi:Exc2 family lipoprotein [Raoultella planticola]
MMIYIDMHQFKILIYKGYGMKYGMITNAVALALSATVLSGCINHQSSAERHARQFVHDSDDNFSPNYRTKKAD